MRILVVHASFDGQTRKIAASVASALRTAGHVVDVRDVDEAHGAVGRCQAVVIGGAIRYGRHSRDLERFVRTHRDAIAALPNAFFSVCLSAGGPGAKPDQARRYLDEFVRRTGWEPRAMASFAGALRYREYNLVLRLLMRMIVGMAGGNTDTSASYDYTDWMAVERFARDFAARLAPAKAA